MRAHVCKARKTNMSQSGKKPPTYSMSRSLYDLTTRSRVLLLHTSPFLPCILFIFKNPVSGTFNSNLKSWKIERVHFKYVNMEENYIRFPIFIQENCLKVSFWRHLLCTSSTCKLNYEVITKCQLSGRPPKISVNFYLTTQGLSSQSHTTGWNKNVKRNQNDRVILPADKRSLHFSGESADRRSFAFGSDRNHRWITIMIW